MTRTVTLRQVGGSVGTTIPKEMAERLHLAPGDEVLVSETPQGLLLTPYSQDVADALDAAARASKKYRNALRALAK
jgi:putative addiction module antidote